MNAIDPASPQNKGTDSCGAPRTLGDTDATGHFVGYIDDEGTCWESCLERDCAITSGRFMEAWDEWYCNGGITEQPDPLDFAQRLCLREASVAEAAASAARETDMSDPLVRIRMRAVMRRMKPNMN